MKVAMLCFGAFKDYLPEGSVGNRCQVTLADEATVADAIEAIGAPVRLAFGILVDGVQSPVETPLTDGDEVTLMPPYSGGSAAGDERLPLQNDERRP